MRTLLTVRGPNLKALVAVVCLALLMAISQSAKAELISGVQADIIGQIFSSPADLRPGGASAHAYYKYPNPPVVLALPDDPHRYQGEATIDLSNSMRPIRLFATDFQGDFFTGVTASAQWIDTIRVSGSGPWPDHLRVQINVHSVLSLPPTGGGGGGKAAVGVFQQDSSGLIGDVGCCIQSEFSPMGVGSATGYFGRIFDDEGIRQGGEGVYGFSEFGDLSVWHTFLDLPRIGNDSEPEGYLLNLHAYASAIAFRSPSVTADAFNSITIGAVTMPNGSAVPGGVSFASGYQIGVPEPYAFTLAAVALGSLAALDRCFQILKSHSPASLAASPLKGIN